MEIFRMTFLAGVLICLIYFVRIWAKDRLPRGVFSLLWKIVLLRLLLPYSIPVGISLNRFFRWGKEENLTITGSSLSFTGFVLSQSKTLPVVPEISDAVINPIILCWFTVAVLLLSAYFIVLIKSRKHIREALPVSNKFLEEWKNKQEIKRPIKIMVHDRIMTPVTIGIRKPMIILPKNMEMENKKPLEYVLTHELVHIKFFDALWKFLSVIGLCIHWFNPLVWLMYSTFERDMEVACDEKVISILGENVKKDYALTLIQLAEQKSSFSLLYNCFGKRPIEERIVSLMKRKKTSFWCVSLSVLLIFFSAFVFITEADATSDKTVFSATDTGLTDSESQIEGEHAKNPESRLYFPVNENGYTYGSCPYDSDIEVEPDLVAVSSVEGVDGYSYSDDLYGTQPNNPEEALEYMKNQPDSRIVPVYESDGETVIGTFKIG